MEYCPDNEHDIPHASTARLLIHLGLNVPCSKEKFDEDLNGSGSKVARINSGSNVAFNRVKNESDFADISFQTFIIVEPDRFLSSPAPPPKLHYTTRWRKLTRKLYQTRC
jgi:hypothetical protein